MCLKFIVRCSCDLALCLNTYPNACDVTDFMFFEFWSLDCYIMVG